MSTAKVSIRSRGTDLFDPVQLGNYRLANRIVTAPLTRSWAGAAGTATPLMAVYYGRRASAGLMVAEATNISAQARLRLHSPDL
jgi:N-ethylmaleimide reductase